MRILAVETSTMSGGVAVMDSVDGPVAETRLNVRAAHSERLMTGVDYVLSQAGLRVEDMDALAVAVGPGSFTGLRIGLSAVKGLAFATGLPVAAVPTLEAFAMCFYMARHPVCTMLDARKKEVYAAAFEWGADGMTRIVPEVAARAGEIALVLSGRGPVLFAGQGAEIYRKDIEAALGKDALFAPGHLTAPSPLAVAEAGLRKAMRGEYSEPSALCPFYIRKSEAEIKSRQGK